VIGRRERETKRHTADTMGVARGPAGLGPMAETDEQTELTPVYLTTQVYALNNCKCNNKTGSPNSEMAVLAGRRAELWRIQDFKRGTLIERRMTNGRLATAHDHRPCWWLTPAV